MSLEAAREVVADFEKFESDVVKGAYVEPLRQPKSVDDVFEILRRDQIDLFPAGVELASRLNDPKAKALQAQIELAWGDAQLVLSDLFGDLATHERKRIQQVEARKAADELTPAQVVLLESLRRSLGRDGVMSDALERLAAEHIAAASVIAHKLIADKPSDYLGYRLAADYYRLLGNWQDFDRMAAKIVATNPKSNGLVFLRAMSAIQRRGHIADGIKLLRKALANDPKFVKAQAEMVLAVKPLDEKNTALDELQKINPHHQIVLWLGPTIKEAFLREQADARLDATENR